MLEACEPVDVDGFGFQLDDRFRLLTGGRRTALARQQTLQAMIDWSWNLLDDKERLLLQRLSVFSGGWSMDAAQSVAADSVPVPEAAMLLSPPVASELTIMSPL